MIKHSQFITDPAKVTLAMADEPHGYCACHTSLGSSSHSPSRFGQMCKKHSAVMSP